MFKKFMHRYMAPADDGGSAGGGDRGDDFAPSGDDATRVEDPVKDEVKDEVKPEAKVAPEPEPEPEPETKAETAEEKATKEKSKKDTRVPLARHEALLERERELRRQAEAQLVKSQQATQVAETNVQLEEAETKLLAMEKEHAKLLNDGLHNEAAAKMAEIRRLERSVNETKSDYKIHLAEARAYERVKYDTTVDRLEAAYPAINPDHADYDADRTKEVIELRDGFVATGKYSRAEAIQKAAKTLLGASTTRQTAAVETEVRVDKDEVSKEATKDAGKERTEAARRKAADTVNKQPASLEKVGLDSDSMGGGLSAKAVMKMNQDQFSKLDEESLARIRGDELV